MAILRSGFAEIRDRFNPADYLRRIDPQRILDHYGARNQSEQRNKKGEIEVIHSCLLDQVEPHHANQDENPSAAMNVDAALYACYGYWMGGIFDFVLKMEQKEDLHDIVDVLGTFLSDSVSAHSADEFRAELAALFRAGEARPPTLSTPAYAESAIRRWTGVRHPYLTQERGITDAAYDQLRLGYGDQSRRVVFPHYVGGKLLGWQQRAVPSRDGQWPGSVDALPKYKNNPSFPKSTTVYNIDAVRPGGAPTVVVESPMSVARAISLGYPDPIVATFGATIPRGQLDVLRGLGPVVLWFDADPAGWKAEIKVCDGLHRHQQVSVVVPEQGKDLGDYDSLDEIRDKIAAATPAVLRMIEHRRTR